MRYIKICDQSCRRKIVYFSQKEENFVYFKDQFKANVILRVLTGQCDETEFKEKKLKPYASEEAKRRNKHQA